MSNYTSAYVIQSAGFAMKIQEEYSKKANRVDKGVHRQSLWVLWRTAMPSVLTEIGYLTNPQEEKFLGSEKGQDYLATCLFRAFRKYKDDVEGIQAAYNDEIENQKPLEKEVYISY
jgi:N-acetylmuramoyl-L-alanine amidase